MKKQILVLSTFFMCLTACTLTATAQQKPAVKSSKHFSIKTPSEMIRYGIASYYASKFHGRKTASGEVYRNELITAACNILPLHTWVRITNLSNGNSIIAKINDRLHPKNKRLVDVSNAGAKQLGYISSGLTKVKLEVLHGYNPETGTVEDVTIVD